MRRPLLVRSSRIRFVAAALLAGLVAACSSTPRPTVSAPPVAAAPPPPPPRGSRNETFVAELPAASSPLRRVTLTLVAGGAATLSIDYRNGLPPVVDRGTWKAEGRDGVRLEFLGRDDGRPGASPLFFHRDGLVLAAREWSREEWGERGLTLKAIPLSP